ncbi:hypothetical protein M885DRAFT_507345 [Pelagophyceae sp. CCMP2097]|nr:hypothetical protein M885DRAFT_507345 [Pelagophyceae sp. CCMP2097]
MDAVSALILQSGATCFGLIGATLTFAIYDRQVSGDAQVLADYARGLPEDDVRLAVAATEANAMLQHAMCVKALVAWSGVSAYWSVMDFRAYRRLPIDDLRAYFAKAPFPMLRPASIGALGVFTGVTFLGLGGVQFSSPKASMLGDARKAAQIARLAQLAQRRAKQAKAQDSAPR